MCTISFLFPCLIAYAHVGVHACNEFGISKVKSLQLEEEEGCLIIQLSDSELAAVDHHDLNDVSDCRHKELKETRISRFLP
ncbi:hypothetical protein MKW98_002054 [Papaver atlanticum]|uniref:Uncharacterized protein n=1 Tax=Papaver atlanticum TaxID=357466 RepID=A0AAD4RU98_9MAGN|nr:hypothetical protein MKW98_002054 [Papaver atlanticum]